MSVSLKALHGHLFQLSDPILESLSRTPYTPPEGTNFSMKSALESLFPNPKPSTSNPSITEPGFNREIQNFTLALALLSTSRSSLQPLLSWIPQSLSIAADSAFLNLSKGYINVFGERNLKSIAELGLECDAVSEENRLVVELMLEVVPILKGRIKESSIDKTDDSDEFFAASARVPVGLAIVAAYQFRWFVTQIDYPHLGKLCNLVIPCALTALDHWSPDVKGQGMITFTHLAKNVNAADFGLYEDVILDACCQNIASSDEIWHFVVEMSVLLVTCIQRSNPRSSWFERMLNEMLSHLERQPRNKERRLAWLEFIEPLFNGLGLVLLAHFRRIFALFFKWMHADDDQTVQLVLKRIHTVIRLTWIRNTPYVERLVDELAVLYKDAAIKKAREEIRSNILQILVLLQKCKGLQFEEAWDKHRNDPDLTTLGPSLSGRGAAMVVQ